MLGYTFLPLLVAVVAMAPLGSSPTGAALIVPPVKTGVIANPAIQISVDPVPDTCSMSLYNAGGIIGYVVSCVGGCGGNPPPTPPEECKDYVAPNGNVICHCDGRLPNTSCWGEYNEASQTFVACWSNYCALDPCQKLPLPDLHEDQYLCRCP